MSESEKFGSIEKIINTGTPEKEKEAFEEIRERFDDQESKTLEKKEREKTPHELFIIERINEDTNKLRRSYGLENFNIPAQNIHVIKEKGWWLEENNGVFISALQGIAVKEQGSLLSFAHKVFHESIHFKSYGALAYKKVENDLDSYRSGFSVQRIKDQKRIFNPLNEALTEELAKRFTEATKNVDFFKHEARHMNDFIHENPYLGLDAETYTFNKKKKIFSEEVELIAYTYLDDRRALHLLVDKIFQKNESLFQDEEEVLNIFFKALFTGNLSHIGKLVEKTFGAGTFKKIAEAENGTEFYRVVDSL